jgi:hypothetical protein
MQAKLCGAIAAVFLSAGVVSEAAAGDGCCAHCRRPGPCQKVCRLVCEEKKVEVVCWGCKAEDFCLTGPNKAGCRHTEEVCAECGESGICTAPRKFIWTEWIPCTAKIFTRKKLMKKVEVQKTPSFKWVIEELCVECEANCPCAEVPPGVDLPPPPFSNAKLKYGRAPAS